MATTSKTSRKPAPRKSAAPAARRPAATKAAKKAAPPKKPAAAAKPKKPAAAPAELKVVRDGFTMPQADYDKIKSMKALCLKNGVEVKKSQLLRAGLIALEALPLAELLQHIAKLAPVKAGRKKKKA
ncbi:MAG TPA: hypothetical protein VH105_26965 [Burkholderiales bacterium]|jgi:hypothetical protein|nr:hypothetical protein [Burkholderiales bacterium]